MAPNGVKYDTRLKSWLGKTSYPAAGSCNEDHAPEQQNEYNAGRKSADRLLDSAGRADGIRHKNPGTPTRRDGNKGLRFDSPMAILLLFPVLSIEYHLRFLSHFGNAIAEGSGKTIFAGE